MAEANWYVVHTYSGYENKVKANIEKTIENRGLQEEILEVRVPLEDIVEELFGEIEDEHDVDDYIAKQTDDGSYLLSARLEIERVNEMFGIHLPVSDEYQTIAGFILYRYKNFPKMHEAIKIDRFRFKIMKVESNKIELVTLKIEE